MQIWRNTMGFYRLLFNLEQSWLAPDNCFLLQLLITAPTIASPTLRPPPTVPQIAPWTASLTWTSPLHRFFDQCQLWLWKVTLLTLTCRKETLSKKIGWGPIMLVQRWCWKVPLCIFLKSCTFLQKLPMARFDLRTSCMAGFLTLVLTTWLFQLIRNFGFCWLLIQSQSPYKLKILKTYG